MKRNTIFSTLAVGLLLAGLLIVGACSSPSGGTNPNPNPNPGPGPGPLGGEDGTLANPWKVYDVATLQKVGKDPANGWTLGAYYIQTADIDMAGKSFTTIGGGGLYSDWPDSPFTGSFDGQNHTIKNLTIDNKIRLYYDGLFSCIDTSGTVKNLGVIDCKMIGWNYLGSIAGGNYGTVQNCYATGSVEGHVETGGVVGFNYGTVVGCYATGSVEGNGEAGGVVGQNGGTVVGCHATGNVTGFQAGGVVGRNRSAGAIIKSCYATGSVEGDRGIGGVAGCIEYVSGTVENCAALNPGVKGASDTGRVDGYSDSWGTLTNNWANDLMLNNSGDTTWGNIGPGNENGADAALIATQSQGWWKDNPGFAFGNSDTDPWVWDPSHEVNIGGTNYVVPKLYFE